MTDTYRQRRLRQTDREDRQIERTDTDRQKFTEKQTDRRQTQAEGDRQTDKTYTDIDDSHRRRDDSHIHTEMTVTDAQRKLCFVCCLTP